ncbi:glycosyltransferase family 2 protein [Limibacter armeniacum]|uniref:glycosyltransferase family 2 protein n=1 Tax=Limibacter armeniacum TaxID=466084 RepID=UPI002FE62900
MKISGFTFLKNTTKLYYPVKESILSILDIVDEFVIAVGDNDPDDNTLGMLESIGSDKIRVINTVWDLDKYPNGTVYAQQTDIAMKACTGDWLFYIQGDEAVHEKDHQKILDACSKYVDDPDVEGLLFRYMHFYGDYEHYFRNHCWYPNEIRIVRNLPDVHSFRDAQSFRKIPNFDGVSYHSKEGAEKLKVVEIDADIYHYGWVRPPELMTQKTRHINTNYKGKGFNADDYEEFRHAYDYGRLDRAKVFKGSHPALMQDKIKQLDWKDKLRFSGPTAINRDLKKHEKLKYRILSFLEEKFLGGRLIGGYKNYKLIKK